MVLAARVAWVAHIAGPARTVRTSAAKWLVLVWLRIKLASSANAVPPVPLMTAGRAYAARRPAAFSLLPDVSGWAGESTGVCRNGIPVGGAANFFKWRLMPKTHRARDD